MQIRMCIYILYIYVCLKLFETNSLIYIYTAYYKVYMWISQWIQYMFYPRLGMWSFDGCGMPPIALACIDEVLWPYPVRINGLGVQLRLSMGIYSYGNNHELGYKPCNNGYAIIFIYIY